MKKLFTLILILCLLLPVFALGEDPEIDYTTGYAHLDLLNDGAPMMSMIYFSSDGTCYYLTQMFHTDEPGLGRSFVGTWEYTGDGNIFARIGNKSTVTLRPVAMGCFVDSATLDLYAPFYTLIE